MTRREQDKLALSLERSRQQCRELQAENEALWGANEELVVERNVTDVLLGHALDLLREQLDRGVA